MLLLIFKYGKQSLENHSLTESKSCIAYLYLLFNKVYKIYLTTCKWLAFIQNLYPEESKFSSIIFLDVIILYHLRNCIADLSLQMYTLSTFSCILSQELEKMMGTQISD